MTIEFNTVYGKVSENPKENWKIKNMAIQKRYCDRKKHDKPDKGFCCPLLDIISCTP